MRRSIEQQWVGRTVVVHTFRGPSLQGVLLAAHKDAWALGHVRHLDEDAPLAGQVAVPRINGFLQLSEIGA